MENRADMTRVSRWCAIVPSVAEISESDRDRAKFSRVPVSAQLFIEFEVFGNLTDVDSSMNGVVGILHQINSGGDSSKKRVVDAF